MPRRAHHDINHSPGTGAEDVDINQSLHKAFELAPLKSGASLITFTDATGIEEAVVDYKGARIKLACYHANTIVWACHIGDTAMLDVEKTPGAALRAPIRVLDGHFATSGAVAA